MTPLQSRDDAPVHDKEITLKCLKKVIEILETKDVLSCASKGTVEAYPKIILETENVTMYTKDTSRVQTLNVNIQIDWIG